MEYRVDGKVYRQRFSTCGKEGCKCQDGELHGPYWFAIQPNRPMKYVGKELPGWVLQKHELLKVKENDLRAIRATLDEERETIRRLDRELSAKIRIVDNLFLREFVSSDDLDRVGLENFFDNLF